MPKLKEVLSTEVHWQVADWHTRDQANIRIRQLMGDDARYFAPVYVTHSGYYWADADPAGWNLLTDASEADSREARAIIERLRAKALSRYPAQEQRISQIFTRPNDDFVFIKRRPDGTLDVRMTGWGFANFHRAYGGSIIDTPSDDHLREVKVCFSIDGRRVADREFDLWRSTSWAPMRTDHDGYYSLGMLGPGTQVQVRDKATGKERIETIADDTAIIDVDVTEYLTVRVCGRHDNIPIEGETASVVYGSRVNQLSLVQGVAECRLPWLEGEVCKVSLRGETQERQLDKDIVNSFNFDFVTPVTPRTPVKVRVHGDGAPIAGEPVTIVYRDTVLQLTTDANGEAATMFDTPASGETLRPVTATVRDSQMSEELGENPVVFDFCFDTPVREEFDATLLVVDMDNDPVAGYPIKVNIGNNSGDFLTDANGCIALGRVFGGDVMTVYDGRDSAYSKTYTLNARQPQYVFQLPYATCPHDGDCTLRVIELNGQPAAGVTCILEQNGKRMLSHLDQNGETHFASADFEVGKEVGVFLYSERRSFPNLGFTLEADEKEYELVEVKGPYPWWKVLLEICAVIAAAAALLALSAVWHAIFEQLPLIFA